MFRSVVLFVAFALSPLAALAEAHMVRVEASGSVAEAADRLEAAVNGAGATVFARVDHGGGAAAIEMDLGEAELLVFGNPRLGTPVLQADIRAGLVLPLRVLVYDDGGQTVFLYEDPAAMLSDYEVPGETEAVGRMTGALANLTRAAAN
ncbi:MAG: DUF302 domain-containing protein [Paracoccaceae bacterium]|nr:DUF302 domain-containing protein [Paracoccaceae bacterium]